MIITILARTKSSRLPKKVIRKIAGKMVIEHVIDRIKSQTDLPIVLCTTGLSEDNIFEKIAANNNINCFRNPGHSTDIINLQYHVAKKYCKIGIINIDADDIFFNQALIDESIDFLKFGHEVVINNGYPLGSTPVVLSLRSIERVYKRKCSVDTETGWFRYYAKLCKISYFTPKNPIKDYRLTLDYPEDFTLARIIIKRLGSNPNYYDVIKFLDDNPKIANINAHLNEQYWSRIYQTPVEVRND